MLFKFSGPSQPIHLWKVLPSILAIVVEIGRNQMKNVECYKLSKLGATHIQNCNTFINTPSILHDFCSNNENLFETLTKKICFSNDGHCDVIDARRNIEPAIKLQLSPDSGM